jgi:predicted PurR-regulated permease PerM
VIARLTATFDRQSVRIAVYLLAVLINFIPCVGALLMTIPAVMLALVLSDLQTTLLVVLGYLLANTVIGSILEPRIMGRGLGSSTLAVFLMRGPRAARMETAISD